MTEKIITLEDRMRSYEMDNRLPPNMPVIIRIDGRAFSKFTRGMDKPFDQGFIGLGSPRDIVGLHCKQLLKGVGCPVGLQRPDFHLAKALPAKLGLTS